MRKMGASRRGAMGSAGAPVEGWAMTGAGGGSEAAVGAGGAASKAGGGVAGRIQALAGVRPRVAGAGAGTVAMPACGMMRGGEVLAVAGRRGAAVEGTGAVVAGLPAQLR